MENKIYEIPGKLDNIKFKNKTEWYGLTRYNCYAVINNHLYEGYADVYEPYIRIYLNFYESFECKIDDLVRLYEYEI